MLVMSSDIEGSMKALFSCSCAARPKVHRVDIRFTYGDWQLKTPVDYQRTGNGTSPLCTRA